MSRYWFPIPMYSAAFLIAATAAAQEATPSAVRERISAIRDTADLRRIENDGGEMSAGFAALRMWEITGDRRSATRARRYFDRLTSRDPQNAWGHYGHALSLRAEIQKSDGTLVLDDALARGFGYDATSRARRALERAVALDPALPGAASLLADYAIDTRDGSALELSRSTFESAAAGPGAATSALLGLARVAREMQDYPAAAEAAARAAAQSGPLFAASHFELARSLASLPGRAAEAGDAYFAAIAAGDDSLLHRMWADLDIIVRDDERQNWRSAASIDERRSILRDTWDVRGALGALTPRERAAEHLARVNFAWQNYRRVGKAGAAPVTALRWQMVDRRFDDRGVIHIRHGRPAATYGFGLQSYIVWMYRREDGNPVTYHFLKHDAMGSAEAGYTKDYVLRRNLPCPIDPDIAVLDPRLGSLVNSCFSQASLSARLRLEAEEALATDSHNPPFDVALPFTFDWYRFRGDVGRTEVAVAFGVPLSRVPADGLALRLGVSIIDTAGHRPPVRVTATTPPVLRSADPDRILRGRLVLSVEPATDAAFRVDVRDSRNPLAGMVYGGTVDVRDFSGDTMMLSDIVLAEPRAEGNFVRHGQRLALAPTQVFRGGSSRSYYEIYNLRPGSTYRTEISIEKARPGLSDAVKGIIGRGDAIRLHFDDVVPADAASTLTQLRDIDAPLAPGDYIIRITVTSGRSKVERERRFTVPRPDRS